MKQKVRIIMWIGIVILVSTIIFFYMNFVNSLEKRAEEDMRLAAELRVNRVKTFLDEKKSIAVDFASDDFVINSLTKLEIGEGNLESIKLNLSQYILLNKIPQDKDIYGIEVLNSQGIIVSHSGKKEAEEVHEKENRFFKAVFSLGREGIFVSDTFYDKEFNRNAYVIAAPISEGDESLGVVVIKMGLETLAGITTDRDGLGETGEITIVNKDGLLITPSRFLGGNAGVLSQVVDTENLRDCFEDLENYFDAGSGVVRDHEDELLRYTDYRGEKVLGTHLYLNEEKWCLLIQVDKSEVLIDPQKRLLGIFSIILVIIFVLLGLIRFFLSKKNSKKIGVRK